MHYICLRTGALEELILAVILMIKHQDRAKKKMKNPNNVIFIRVKHDLIKINLQDVFMITGMSSYSNIYSDKKQYKLAITLGKLMKMLPGNDFIRIHKSYIVRIDKITEIKKNNNCIVNNKKIPISRRMRTVLIDRLIII